MTGTLPWGPTVVQVATGPRGVTGARGTRWSMGSGSPPPLPADGLIGDIWLDVDTGNVHQATSRTSWELRGSIRGPDGLPGPVTFDDLNGAISTLENSLGGGALLDAGVATGDLIQLVDVAGTPGLPAIDGSQLTGINVDDPVARDMAASALAYAMATNDAASITGAVGSFRLSDDFRTDSLATKTGARYSAANGWYSSEGGGSNVLPAMTAATTSGVTITDSTGRGSPFEAWRGADQNNGTSFMSATTGGAFTWTIDLGSGNSATATGYAITEIHAAEWAGGARTPNAWTFEGSNDGSSWTTLDTRSGITAVAANNRVVYTFSNAVAYRYYRMNVPGKSGSIQGWAEFELLETGDMTLRPTAATITANPSDVLGYFAYVPIDAVTLGTDLVVRYSIDNGVTWAVADLASLGALGSTGEIIARASADVDAQTGSSLVYSIETANLKQIRLTRFVGVVPLY